MCVGLGEGGVRGEGRGVMDRGERDLGEWVLFGDGDGGIMIIVIMFVIITPSGASLSLCG